MKYSLYDDIKETAKLRSSQIAIIDHKNRVSYGDLIKSANLAATELKSAGMKEYSKSVLIGSDSAEYLISALAILANRGVFVSAGKEISNIDFNNLLDGIDIEFAIIEEQFLKNLKPKLLKECKSLQVGSKIFTVFKKCRKNTQNNSSFTDINPAFIRFSSGTTGASKGIVLSHETIKARTEAANHALKISEADVVLWLLPMAHHFAVTIMLFLRKGCTIDIAVDEKHSQIITKLLSGKITFVYATPYHYGNMIRAAQNMKKSGKLQKIQVPDTVRLLISTAMPLTEDLCAKFADFFGRFLNQAYGIIECGLPFINTKANAKTAITVGRHLPKYQVRLALQDESDTAGEILIKGDGFFDAYYDPWCLKEEVLAPGNWFHTGDLGKFLPGGYLHIVGRTKSVINFLGLKVFPEKIENILNTHPAVKEARVRGKNHSEFGEIPVAEIVPTYNSKICEIELTKYCSSHLPSHEIPQEFLPVEEIPKTRSGKILRKKQ